MDDTKIHRRTVLTEAEANRVAQVFQEHRRFVENVARQHAPGPEHVPDIVQSVGMKICQSLNGFTGQAEIKTWLYRMTVNAAVDHYRSEQFQAGRVREALAQTRLPEPVLDPDEHVYAGERVAALSDAIERLRPNRRDLMRHILTDPSVQPGSRSARLRARRDLRRILSDDPRLDPTS